MFTLPKWLEKMPEGPAKIRATKRFYMRMACIYASEKGTIGVLAKLIGKNPHTLQSQYQHIPLTHDVRTRIHKLVGNFVTIPHHIN